MMRKYLYQAAMYPLRLYWYLFRPHGYGVKCIVRRPDGAVLLVRHAYGKGAWTLPGGGIGAGEPARDAARREVREEVGLDVGFREIGAFTSVEDHKRDHIAVFYGETRDDVGTVDAAEIAETGWFDPRQLPEEAGTIARRTLRMIL